MNYATWWLHAYDTPYSDSGAVQFKEGLCQSSFSLNHGGAAAGAMDANAFNAAVRSAHDGVFLPEVSTLTYQGNPIERLSKGFNLIHWKLGVLQCGSAGKPEICLIVYDSCGLRNQSKSGVFNEHSYHTGGPEDTHQVAVAAYAARGLGSLGDPDEVWVACFLKSCRDGQPRDHIAMDLIVVLDVSGSMTLGEFGHIWSMIYYMLYMLYRIEQQKISIYFFFILFLSFLSLQHAKWYGATGLSCCDIGLVHYCPSFCLAAIQNRRSHRDWSVDSERLRTTENSRLALAKEALTSLIPKLRPDDRFGLATFTNEGRVIQPLVPVAELRHEEFLCERLAFCI